MTLSDEEVIKCLKENFVYHSDGTFERKDRANSGGSYDKDGYLIIKIKGKQYKAHRLVYAYFHGKFPSNEIDHINRNRTDNRIENLRDASRLENIANTQQKPNKETGVIGVYRDKTKGLRKRYAFRFSGKMYRFYTIEEAIKARNEMRGNKYGIT